ncbi:DUF4145 domain-containing protein [Streptomyces sp. NPDC051098]|uniref:DUF4145 domain-containing protein n=1 Tax=Streptomyces sp. NPDC051098 TaxID=3155411 RepID=UPI0034467EC5
MTMVSEAFSLPEDTWPTNGYGSPDADRPVHMAAFMCANESCTRLSIGWAELSRTEPGTPKSRLPRADLEWEPLKIRKPGFPDVPDEVASTASEAHACLSIGAARGAVSLARAVVEATAKTQGIDQAGIIGKINALRDGGYISALTAETSHVIRKDGNSIAHGDIGDEPISVDDATAILKFMDALLDEVFQRPALLKRLQQSHEDRKIGQDAPVPPSRSSIDYQGTA